MDAEGAPLRIDKAYSWDAPLAAHGLMHMVITNAAKGDPYPVDVLFMYMTNMSWNSSMNVPAILNYLTETDPQTGRTVHFPRSCLHCETPACVTVCPTGASYKRAEDGIVLVNPETCIGCKLCSWACPYGAREYDYSDGVMKKCTLCVDRIYNETLEPEDRLPACVRACPTGARHFGDIGDPESDVSKLVAERSGFDLLPEFGYKPVNKYLPPRARRDATTAKPAPANAAHTPGEVRPAASKFFMWADKVLSR